MSDRDLVFQQVRKALKPFAEADRKPMPEWSEESAIARSNGEFARPWDQFMERFEAVHGVALEGFDALRAWLVAEEFRHGYCDPAFASEFADFSIDTTFDPERVDDYEFGITRASAVIAETGSIVLKDQETASRLGALAPWTHIALVEEARILPDVPTTIRDFGEDPYIVFATGPSKTADIEGILIEGVHGPGQQICCLI